MIEQHTVKKAFLLFSSLIRVRALVFLKTGNKPRFHSIHPPTATARQNSVRLFHSKMHCFAILSSKEKKAQSTENGHNLLSTFVLL